MLRILIIICITCCIPWKLYCWQNAFFHCREKKKKRKNLRKWPRNRKRSVFIPHPHNNRRQFSTYDLLTGGFDSKKTSQYLSNRRSSPYCRFRSNDPWNRSFSQSKYRGLYRMYRHSTFAVNVPFFIFSFFFTSGKENTSTFGFFTDRTKRRRQSL